jgi:hypothetical protein
MHGIVSHGKSMPHFADPHRRSFIACAALLAIAPALADIGGRSTRASGMPERIADFRRLTDELDAVDQHADPMRWDDVANRRCRALEALLDQVPASVEEFAAKFEALLDYTEEDSELVALRILAADIRALVEG